METRIYNGYKQFNCGNGWVFTHRAVAQKVLGNEIPEGHEVHHVNGDKLDNRPENLVVLPREEHQKLHRDSANDSSGSLTSTIGNYADFLLSNMVAADSAYLQVSATDMVLLQLKLSTIDMDISTNERTVQNLNEHGAFDGQDTSNGNSELQKQIDVCRKNIEGLMAEKDLIQQRLKESENRFNKQVQDVADKYSKIAENIASSLSGLFGGKR
jgi:hypothetical protein